MSYTRIIPRDLFNEANLLNGLGKLVVLIESAENGHKLRVELEDNAFEGFLIEMDQTDGSIFARNVAATICDEPIALFVPLNSRTPCPLHYKTVGGAVGRVFNSDGTISQEFLDLLAGYEAEGGSDHAEDEDREPARCGSCRRFLTDDDADSEICNVCRRPPSIGN